MKQIPLLQGKALLVETPNLKLITTIHTGLLVAGVNQKDVSSKCRKIDKGDVKGFLQLPPGNWRIIGMLSEVTEEQADEIVSKVINGQHFQNYAFTSPVNRWVKTALESLESAILAEGYYLDENPIPEPDISRYPNDDWITDYNNAQSRVLDRSRCLLLGRESN